MASQIRSLPSKLLLDYFFRTVSEHFIRHPLTKELYLIRRILTQKALDPIPKHRYSTGTVNNIGSKQPTPVSVIRESNNGFDQLH